MINEVIFTLSEGALLIYFLKSGVEKLLWHWQPGLEPTTLDLCFQSGAFDLSATATLIRMENCIRPLA